MGILEKLGLVESTDSVKEESNGDVQAQFYAYASSQSELSVNIEPVPDTMLLDGVIDIPEIYEKFELSNTDNSIYKIDEISSVLPKELNNETRKMTVISLLGTSKLSLDEILEDGEKRKGALLSTLDAFTTETNTIVNNKKSEIEELEAKIDELKTQINDRKKMQEQQEEIIATENEKIDKIINFIK